MHPTFLASPRLRCVYSHNLRVDSPPVSYSKPGSSVSSSSSHFVRDVYHRGSRILERCFPVLVVDFGCMGRLVYRCQTGAGKSDHVCAFPDRLTSPHSAELAAGNISCHHCSRNSNADLVETSSRGWRVSPTVTWLRIKLGDTPRKQKFGGISRLSTCMFLTTVNSFGLGGHRPATTPSSTERAGNLPILIRQSIDDSIAKPAWASKLSVVSNPWTGEVEW